ncbi:MAG: hypothetical protein QXT73_08505 [Candidatus Methanomethylicaceae archaeon]
MGIDISLQGKSLWQMPEGVPKVISEPSRESRAMLFLGKPSMGFLIVIIPEKTLTGFLEGSKSRTRMPSKHPLLPESIETLHRGVSARFSSGDKDQMDTQKQMESDNLRKAEGVAASSWGGHLIIHLRNLGDPHGSPRFHRMPAEREGLFIRELTGKSGMACHIKGMKRVKSGDSFWPSEVSRPHKVCLMKIPHLFGFDRRIGLRVFISFGFGSFGLSMTRKNSGNRRDGGDTPNLSLVKLPMDNLWPNTRKGITSALMGLQFCPDGENLLNQAIRGFSPNSFWSTLLISMEPMLIIPPKPFRNPESASLNQPQYLIEAESLIIKWHRFTAFLVFILIFHRLFPPSKSFWKKSRRYKF